MDVSEFRVHYQEFADTTKYPDELITYHAGFAETSVSTLYSEPKRSYLVELLTAHLISEATAMSASSSSNGGGGGVGGGRVSSKSVMEVSISYDYSGIKDTPHNSTRYGQKYDAETSKFRLGGYVVGGGNCPCQ